MADTPAPPPPTVSRRTLLAGGLAGASTLLAPLAQAAVVAGDPPLQAVGRPDPTLRNPPPLPEGEKLGFAIVGLGKLALGQVLLAFGKARACKPAALISGNPDKAKAVAARVGLPDNAIYDYAGFDRIANDPRIHVVYIILPNALHAEYTIRALRAGKHVLCEKPMATSVQDCAAMIQAAAKANRKLMIAYRCQYEPHNLAAMRLIRSGRIGALRVIGTDNGRQTDPSDPADQWRLDKALSGGGALFDIGIYGVNGARYLAGEEPVELRAWSHTAPDDSRFRETPDVVAWQFRFPSGVLANGSTSFSYAGTSRLQAIGTDGRIVLDPATEYGGLRLTLHKGQDRTEPQLPSIDQFAREMDHIAFAVRRDTPIVSPGEEGLQDIRLLEAILDSARTGQPVRTDWGYKRSIDPAAASDKQPA